jgi:hypothetical protein
MRLTGALSKHSIVAVVAKAREVSALEEGVAQMVDTTNAMHASRPLNCFTIQRICPYYLLFTNFPEDLIYHPFCLWISSIINVHGTPQVCNNICCIMELHSMGLQLLLLNTLFQAGAHPVMGPLPCPVPPKLQSILQPSGNCVQMVICWYLQLPQNEVRRKT